MWRNPVPPPPTIFDGAIEVPKKTKAFELIAFLGAVCKTGDAFRGMDVIQVVDDHLVATDGRRLHGVSFAKLGPYAELIDRADDVVYEVVKRVGGGYVLLKRARGEGVALGPNIPRLLEQYTKPKWWCLTWLGQKRCGSDPVIQELLFSFPKPTALNLDYLQSLPGGEYYVEWWAQNKGVMFRSDDVYSLIMPLNLDVQEWPPALEDAS